MDDAHDLFDHAQEVAGELGQRDGRAIAQRWAQRNIKTREAAWDWYWRDDAETPDLTISPSILGLILRDEVPTYWCHPDVWFKYVDSFEEAVVSVIYDYIVKKWPDIPEDE